MTIDLADLEVRTRALLASDRLGEPTRRVLQARLDQGFAPPTALDAQEMATLQAVCLRVIPEPELVERSALAAAYEARLAGRTPRGWRHAEAPADLELIRAGLHALDAPTDKPFPDLSPDQQDRRLAAAGAGEEPFASGSRLEHWFEELISGLTEIYYAHPLVQVWIGYDGMADAPPLAVGLDAVGREMDALGR